MKKYIFLIFILVLVVGGFIIKSMTVFSVQPIGAMPEGTTLLIWKKGDMPFFESPDGMCIRKQGYVSLMCRTIALGAAIDEDSIVMRLPYIKSAYLLSTGNKEFDK
ncbi:hypothetical protein NVR49_21335 [Enterobacter roggenkampii]|uniref:hypothetical protein n=1 Tax=Enterobacter roggenkampii TaxID=1812935 RepID=UPI0025513E2E|nr:hypothetical protein [Enterobacter roggenkampii]MDL0009129.1 hypothetical protein [Enterobacter roggenkampii]